MWRRIFAVGLALSVFFPAFAQVTKQFSVENKKEIEKVDFSFKVNSGYCLLKSGVVENEDLINIYSNEDLDNYAHRYNKEIKNKVCHLSLSLEKNGGESLSQKISYKMFGGNDQGAEKIWKIFLTPEKPYRLNLNYGVGVANIDLTGLAIENLRVNSGNADVKIDYSPNTGNKVEMDTFYVKVDLGSVDVKRLNLSKSKVVMADVGFGNMSLDFSDKPTISSHIKGSVGAGNLLITLPDKEIPVIITVNESWLCKVKLTNDFKKISANTYVNTAYKEGVENLLSFNLDVSMGNIIFKNKDLSGTH